MELCNVSCKLISFQYMYGKRAPFLVGPVIIYGTFCCVLVRLFSGSPLAFYKWKELSEKVVFFMFTLEDPELTYLINPQFQKIKAWPGVDHRALFPNLISAFRNPQMFAQRHICPSGGYPVRDREEEEGLF